ncbi:uncharacterized protein LOC127809782 [Diospyros lotus]|uniref:uncharacterized protein LOC127809782 n=1 Tax=Diospyros lotus TaxID=55363 RepID=UPI00224E6917|nr:uncharacterized protein LOC127809782 [Diospyros lotus]
MTTDMAPPLPRNPSTTATEESPSTEPETKTLDDELPSASAPPPRNPSTTATEESPSTEPETKTLDDELTSTSAPPKNPMAPPPPKSSEPSESGGSHEHPPQEEPIAADARPESRPNVAVPYTIPDWSGPPSHQYFLEVLKEGSIIDQLHIYEKGAYMFGRVDLCDFVLEHPTISRFHAVLQFKRNGSAYLYDLGSTHGTFVNKNEVKKRVYVDLHVGDVIRFGHSSRLYIIQGPAELMPPESDLKGIRNARMRDEMQDMEASLVRARVQASLADGISWGMKEDAIEETEDDIDEITWQTFKGQLTEKQEKTREKVVKRLEKIAHMKKEIDAIRAKDISQGGLTQGQQTQIARNEQRISQIMEELENLEETLNESIRESMGARAARTSHGTKKGVTEDEDYLSDEDEFYDRTKKVASNQKGGETQSIETADTLLDKKDAIIKEIEEKKKLLLEEKDRMVSENEGVADSGDTLDAYMSGLSSQLVLDKTEQLQEELSTLQSQLDRILYLLKIADPAGEAARKRELNLQDPKPNLPRVPSSASVKQTLVEPIKKSGTENTMTGSTKKKEISGVMMELGKKLEAIEEEEVVDATEGKTTVYTVVKPQWLGAARNVETEESQQEALLDVQEPDQFVDYKDRKKVLRNQESGQGDPESEIENAAPGLIVRKPKPKQVENNASETKASEHPTQTSVGAEFRAADAVALLLKHKRGYHASEDEAKAHHIGDGDIRHGNETGKDDNKRQKRVLGPERPPFLESTDTEYDTWVPPEGQSGDGRTSLNDRYGY